MIFRKFNKKQKSDFNGSMQNAYSITFSLASNAYEIPDKCKDVSVIYGVKWFNLSTFSWDFASVAFGRANGTGHLSMFCYWKENGKLNKRYLCSYENFGEYEFDMVFEKNKIMYVVNNSRSKYFKNCYINLNNLPCEKRKKYTITKLMKPCISSKFFLPSHLHNGVYFSS